MSRKASSPKLILWKTGRRAATFGCGKARPALAFASKPVSDLHCELGTWFTSKLVNYPTGLKVFNASGCNHRSEGRYRKDHLGPLARRRGGAPGPGGGDHRSRSAGDRDQLGRSACG